MKTFAIVLFGLIAMLGLGWLLTANGLAMKSFFAPRSVAIDNKVFHESQQFNDAMMRDLDDARGIYADPNTTPEQKAAIRAALTHRFSGYDTSKLSPDQRDFLTALRGF